MLNVVTLGVHCDIEDLQTAPRRQKFARQAGFADDPNADSQTSILAESERKKLLAEGEAHFLLKEFADLSDGRRVILKDDRGWSRWPPKRGNSAWKRCTGRELTQYVLKVLDTDDHDEWHQWVLDQFRSLELDVDASSVHCAPYVVEYGPDVSNELRKHNQESH